MYTLVLLTSFPWGPESLEPEAAICCEASVVPDRVRACGLRRW